MHKLSQMPDNRTVSAGLNSGNLPALTASSYVGHLRAINGLRHFRAVLIGQVLAGAFCIAGLLLAGEFIFDQVAFGQGGNGGDASKDGRSGSSSGGGDVVEVNGGYWENGVWHERRGPAAGGNGRQGPNACGCRGPSNFGH